MTTEVSATGKRVVAWRAFGSRMFRGGIAKAFLVHRVGVRSVFSPNMQQAYGLPTL